MNVYQMLNHYGFTTEYAYPQNLIDPSSQRCGVAGLGSMRPTPSGNYHGPVGALHGPPSLSRRNTDLGAIAVGLAAGGDLGSARKVCRGAAATTELVGMIGGAIADEPEEGERDPWQTTQNIGSYAAGTVCDAGRRTDGPAPAIDVTSQLPGARPAPTSSSSSGGVDKNMLILGGGLLAVVALVVLAKRK
jgi:hypothetical protein